MKNGGDKLGYIVIPMDLSERQALIYMQLYRKCNFQNMTVKYTLEQIASDIGIIDIPTKTIYKNIKSMIDRGYIQVIKKASKGNPPLYRIIKINEILGEPKVNQERAKGEPKHSKINSSRVILESQGRTKGEPKGHPIKEKEKEKDNNIYSHWNSKNIICHKALTKEINKAIDKALAKYSEEEIIYAIDNYSEILNSKFYFNYKWSLKDFLNRSNGISTFMNDGSNKVNYEEWKHKPLKGKEESKPIKLRGWDD
jgi:sugar-specific transcriptional regulator TrmB